MNNSGSETDFLVWAKQFVSQVSANPELYFLDAERISELETELALFQQAFDDAVATAAASELELLTTGLSSKIWQKILILESGSDTAADSGIETDV